VLLADGSRLYSDNLIWTAGVSAVSLKGFGEQEFGRGKRYLVDRTNKLIHHDSIYALGDVALIESDPKYPNGHPQVAQVAI
jgi:NADH dehydrogenase